MIFKSFTLSWSLSEIRLGLDHNGKQLITLDFIQVIVFDYFRLQAIRCNNYVIWCFILRANVVGCVTSSSSETVHGCVRCRKGNYSCIFTIIFPNHFTISVAFIALNNGKVVPALHCSKTCRSKLVVGHRHITYKSPRLSQPCNIEYVTTRHKQKSDRSTERWRNNGECVSKIITLCYHKRAFGNVPNPNRLGGILNGHPRTRT